MLMHEWNPFTSLPKADLTGAGLLRLESSDGEVELIRRGPVELRHENVEPMGGCPPDAKGVWTSRCSNLTLTVTTHRLVWSISSRDTGTDARFLHFSNLQQIQSAGGPTLTQWNASHKLILSTFTYGDLTMAFRSASEQKDRDECSEQIEKALERRLWERNQRLQERQEATAAVAKRRVGVDHILTKEKIKHKRAARVADEALGGDAEQLLQEAAELLQVIRKYVATLQKQEHDDDQDTSKLSDLLQDMGMASALTKKQMQGKTGQRDYLELTARQVTDFMSPRLKQMGGIASLTDVFCLFNRARGTNLISPEDLTAACELLEDLNLNIRKRTFPSGIVVLELKEMSGQPSKILDLCPTTAMEASHTLKLSPLLALEQLEEAERQGLICRDTTLETTRFYRNRFSDFQLTTA